MENVLEPIELNDANLTAVVGGFLDFDFGSSVGTHLVNAVSFIGAFGFVNAGNMNITNGSTGGINIS